MNLLTEIGEMMINSDAHTTRIVRNLERIAKGLTIIVSWLLPISEL